MKLVAGIEYLLRKPELQRSFSESPKDNPQLVIFIARRGMAVELASALSTPTPGVHGVVFEISRL